MTKQKEKISLYHPSYGHFEGLGDTKIEASKKCLKKIAETLKGNNVSIPEIKQELNYASTLIKKKVSKNG